MKSILAGFTHLKRILHEFDAELLYSLIPTDLLYKVVRIKILHPKSSIYPSRIQNLNQRSPRPRGVLLKPCFQILAVCSRKYLDCLFLNTSLTVLWLSILPHQPWSSLRVGTKSDLSLSRHPVPSITKKRLSVSWVNESNMVEPLSCLIESQLSGLEGQLVIS